MREGKGEDLIGQILTAQQKRSHRVFWGWNSNAWDASASSYFPFPSPGRACSQAICRSKNALRGKYRHRTLDAFLLAKGKEREGFIKPNWCRGVLTLSILCHYKTYKKILIVCFLFFCMGSCLHVASACMRYRRRINDISLGLVMFSNIYMYISCATPDAEETSHVWNSFNTNTGYPVSTCKN